MNAHVHPVFAEILAQFEAIPVGKVAPAPTRIPASMPSTQLLEAAMDETADYAVANAKCDRITDADIEALTDAADMAASAEQLEDVRHDMRSEWERARFWAGGLNPPRLPIVVGRKLVLLSFPQILALCGETSHLYVMLADVFRGASPEALQAHLRQAWIDNHAQALADIGWAA